MAGGSSSVRLSDGGSEGGHRVGGGVPSRATRGDGGEHHLDRLDVPPSPQTVLASLRHELTIALPRNPPLRVLDEVCRHYSGHLGAFGAVYSEEAEGEFLDEKQKVLHFLQRQGIPLSIGRQFLGAGFDTLDTLMRLKPEHLQEIVAYTGAEWLPGDAAKLRLVWRDLRQKILTYKAELARFASSLSAPSGPQNTEGSAIASVDGEDLEDIRLETSFGNSMMKGTSPTSYKQRKAQQGGMLSRSSPSVYHPNPLTLSQPAPIQNLSTSQQCFSPPPMYNTSSPGGASQTFLPQQSIFNVPPQQQPNHCNFYPTAPAQQPMILEGGVSGLGYGGGGGMNFNNNGPLQTFAAPLPITPTLPSPPFPNSSAYPFIAYPSEGVTPAPY